MALTAESSPYYPAWVSEGERDLDAVRKAVADRDFEVLAQVAGQCSEDACDDDRSPRSCIGVLGALPFWSGWRRGKEKVPCFFTMDAGPNVKSSFLEGADAFPASAS